MSHTVVFAESRSKERTLIEQDLVIAKASEAIRVARVLCIFFMMYVHMNFEHLIGKNHV